MKLFNVIVMAPGAPHARGGVSVDLLTEFGLYADEAAAVARGAQIATTQFGGRQTTIRVVVASPETIQKLVAVVAKLQGAM